MLYNFSKLLNFLDQNGFPQIENLTPYEVIQPVSVREGHQSGLFNYNGGIYLKRENIQFRGYMYKERAYVEKWGVPKAHIFECEKIQEMKAKGNFGSYQFSNSSKVNIINISNNSENLKDQVLSICGFCKPMSHRNFVNTSDFCEFLQKNPTKSQDLDEPEESSDDFDFWNW